LADLTVFDLMENCHCNVLCIGAAESPQTHESAALGRFLVKRVRPGCVRTPSAWAWSQKPRRH